MSSTFVDRQKPVVERQRQECQRRRGRGAELPRETAVGGLLILKLPDEQFVPFFPRLDVALEQCLGLVVTLIVDPSETGPAREFQLVDEILERGLELGQILAMSQGIDECRNRGARQ